MKNLLLLGALICALSTQTFGQSAESTFNAGVIGGIATTQILGDNTRGFNKAGVMFGAYVNTQVSKKLRSEFQITYIQKGSVNPHRPDKGDFVYYKIATDYIEVPLLFRFKNGKFTYGAGASLGVLLSSKESDLNGEVNFPFYTFRSTEAAAHFDLIYNLTDRIQSNIRYSHSIYPISNQAQISRWGLIGGSWNSAAIFALRYTFLK